jgi:DNA repair protein RadA/Sms
MLFYIPIFDLFHTKKSGDVAGPRTVEHMVDCVLYLEGGALLGAGGGGGGGADRGSGDGGGGGISSLRVLRAAKNRFGSSEEVGVYEMGRAGRLIPISDPSSFFLSTRQDNTDAEGCAISVVLEGIRSMTVEVQALVAWSAGSAGYSGRRIVDGISNSRLLLILAVLHKRYGISFRGRDVYVNVVGGMHLGRGSKSGGGSDLAVAVSIVSSLVGIPVRSDTAFVGEVGLLGELRPVHSLDKRISEARRMGFSFIVTPTSPQQKKNRGGKMRPGPKESSAGGIKQLMCDNLLDAINCGLVNKLPSKQPKRGATFNKAQRSTSDGRTRSFGINEDLDIIEDDEDDDYNFE